VTETPAGPISQPKMKPEDFRWKKVNPFPIGYVGQHHRRYSISALQAADGCQVSATYGTSHRTGRVAGRGGPERLRDRDPSP